MNLGGEMVSLGRAHRGDRRLQVGVAIAGRAKEPTLPRRKEKEQTGGGAGEEWGVRAHLSSKRTCV